VIGNSIERSNNVRRVIEVKDLRTYFYTDAGLVKAVDGICYHIEEQEIIGIVGESGCGKSVSQLSILQLVPVPPGRIVSGEVIFDGQDLLTLSSASNEMRSIRGRKIGIVFQEPMTSLNPVLTISRQMTESLELHLKLSKQAAKRRAIELLKLVGIPDVEQRFKHYPHQFSGGMRQRVMIAMALSCNPNLLIADEPTTALDATIQAQLLEIMKDLVDRFKTALTIVTHNLGVVARYAHRIYVMYAGRIVESGTCEDIFGEPLHPYTIGLLNSVPRWDRPRGKRLIPIEGLPPNQINMPPVCAFLPRCPYRTARCEQEQWPELRHMGKQHYIRCYIDVGEKER
jgi:oligopeptide/dipeptide ABC transporter ATP-binding protein